ncbi:uncharacterized protein [Palaemon carinicauda]|uniref:uncharacterized protein n=1 Tax=Palaemon carinicauda TaxID=392227 RepID=UPI0035B629D9
MSEREALVRSRGGYKGVITKWVNKIDSAITAGNVNTLSSIKDLIMKQMKTVHDLNEKILALTTEEDRMKEVEEQAEYEVVIGEHWYKLSNAITAISGSGSAGNPPPTHKTNVRLPKLDLPHFTGDVLERNSFWELYNVSLESENLELNELYTILLHGKLPKSVSETVKRRSGDDWLVFDTFKLEEEIHNLRSFVSTDVSKPGTLSTISTFTVNQSQSVRPKSKGNVNKFSSQQTRKCALCEGVHWWTQCKTYTSRDKKLSRLGFLQLCFVCASNKHFSVDCEKQICGNGCRLKYHRVLCDKQQTSEPSKSTNKSANKPNDNGVQVGTLSVSDQGQKSKQRSILSTATIVLKGKGRHLVRLRGLLDTFAERTFIRRSALKDVQYRSKGTEKIALRGYLISKPVNKYETVSVSIPYKGRLIIMDCIVVDELPEYTKKFNVKRNLKKLCKTKICLADKDFDLPVDKQAPIDMLVGVDNVYNILHPGFRKAGKLILLPTIFGYVVTGSCNAPPVQETQVTVLKLATNEEVIKATHKFDSDIKNDLDILWNLDKVGIDCNELKEHDRKVLEDFESTIVYSEMEKQYVVALPQKSNKSRLLYNLGMALGRVKQQCAKFQKDEAYLIHYQKFLKDQEDRGFIERVDKNNEVENCHYLAHHSVQKDSATTRIKIVFDCSSRQGKNGLSLNDCLWTGPHIMSDLLKVLLQFRTNNYACISDIEKEFPMVQLREEDPNFLWLQDPTDPNSELIIYRFRVVLFGATCSPFLLNATIKSHLAAVRKDTSCTEMVDMMRRGLYVDNLQFTSNNEDELINLFFDANKIFAQAHLYLKEWTSNSDLLNTIAGAYRIKSEKKQTYKVLGLNWNISDDKLTVTPNHLKTGQTKREILSAIAQIYDLLGMLIPITI